MKIAVVAQVEDRTLLDEQLKPFESLIDEKIILVDDNPAQGINNRRKRIAHNHALLKELVRNSDADFIWQLEGDCVLPPYTLQKLIDDFDKLNNEELAYISGVQVGRHGLYALGAWRFGQDTFSSLDYRAEGLQEVDATGFYCLFAERQTWLRGECYWNGEMWGPDVNYGLSLRKKGLKIYCDMNLQIGHKTKSGIIEVSHISTCNVTFSKENNKWVYKTRS